MAFDAIGSPLETEFRTAEDRKLRDRLQIVRMAARGRRPAGIAADPGVSTRTILRWLNAYLEKGLNGLRPRGTLARSPPHWPTRSGGG